MHFAIAFLPVAVATHEEHCTVVEKLQPTPRSIIVEKKKAKGYRASNEAEKKEEATV